eukprot:366278-Chlamydomonas_euryale.AAC.28
MDNNGQNGFRRSSNQACVQQTSASCPLLAGTPLCGEGHAPLATCLAAGLTRPHAAASSALRFCLLAGLQFCWARTPPGQPS